MTNKTIPIKKVNKMKLAEALLLRSDQQKKLASLKQRINANVLVQDGDEPSEDPNELINKYLL